MRVTVGNRVRRARPEWRVDCRLLRCIAEQATGQPLHVALVTDRTIARLNRQFHHVAAATDVLAFDYGGEAELVVSVERAVAQARRYRSTPGRELALYVVHGILHLQGYRDHDARGRRAMRRAERRCLARLARRFDWRALVRVGVPGR